MAFTTEEQELYDFGVGSVPRFLFAQERDEEVMGAYVKMFDAAREGIANLFNQTYILNATGADAKFLDMHAWERVGSRFEDETDIALRNRIRTVRDTVTRPAILTAAQAIIDDEGISGTVYMVELRRWRAYFNDWLANTGTGGTFVAGSGSEYKFTPTVAFARPPYVDISWFPHNWKLVISGAASSGNNGTFPVTSLDANAAVYTNASGVAEADATVSWSIRDYDVDDNLRDGFKAAYFSRGYRLSKSNAPMAFILIIPYGAGATKSTEATRVAVEEMVRQRKGAGYKVIVERRTS
jgi:hypothetical protein